MARDGTPISSRRKLWRRFRRLGVAGVVFAVGVAAGFGAQRGNLLRAVPLPEALAKWIQGSGGRSEYHGWWRPARPGVARAVGEREAADLAALGYASGYETATLDSGVLFHDLRSSAAGFNLYTAGHEPAAILMDMAGRVRHRWTLAYESVWPGPIPDGRMGRTDYWRRVRLLENGDLLAIFDGHGLIKIDRDSRLLWSQSGAQHHALDLDGEGRVYVLAREKVGLPRIHEGRPIFVDVVQILSADGELLRQIPLLEAFERSDYAPLIDRLESLPSIDIFHTNSLQILDGTHRQAIPAFAKGNLLLSLRELDLIAVLDPESERVVWAMTGMWKRQHEPVLLPNGHLLVFDNEGYAGHSRVLEIEPGTQRIVWQYAGNQENGFHSPVCGSNQRLANGNTLIVESTAGRAFEVTPDGRIVWDFVNPHRGGRDDELVAVLMDLVRLPADLPLEWLSR